MCHPSIGASTLEIQVSPTRWRTLRECRHGCSLCVSLLLRRLTTVDFCTWYSRCRHRRRHWFSAKCPRFTSRALGPTALPLTDVYNHRAGQAYSWATTSRLYITMHSRTSCSTYRSDKSVCGAIRSRCSLHTTAAQRPLRRHEKLPLRALLWFDASIQLTVTVRRFLRGSRLPRTVPRRKDENV